MAGGGQKWYKSMLLSASCATAKKSYRNVSTSGYLGSFLGFSIMTSKNSRLKSYKVRREPGSASNLRSRKSVCRLHQILYFKCTLLLGSHFTLLVTTDPATSQTTRLKPPSLNASFSLWLLQTSWFRLLILLLLLLLLLPHICDTFRYDILRISGTLFVWVIKRRKLVRHRFCKDRRGLRQQ